MDPSCMKVAALGRPLYPGMLYNCHRDSFIPGVTLWDTKALRDDLDVHQQHETHLKFAASDTLSEKANLLDISGSLRASFLSGLVEVDGSAKYLKDTKSSAHQCRVTMKYSQTTTFEQLTMKELGHITYPEVFDQKTATHVVTAVLYGARAFMVFDYTKAEDESKQDIEGNLHAVAKMIPGFSIEGNASLTMNEMEKKLSENTSVTFYGDFELEKNPTTYKDALEVFKKLPTLMKQQRNRGVPQTVWLYPLTLLDDKAAKLVREINMSLVSKSEILLEELGEVERRCNDLIRNQITVDFPDLKDRLLQFQQLHSFYKTAFQKELVRVLPAIRSGAQDDKAMEHILSIHYRSPFTANNMNKWLDDITTEIHILSSYTSGLKDLEVVKSSRSLDSILFHPDVDVVVCFSFTSLKYANTYLAALEDIKKPEGFNMLGKTSEKHFSPQATQPWFTNPGISEGMRQKLSLFTSFSKANKYEKRIKFIIASISDPSNPGASIRLYQKGVLKKYDFQPVSKPSVPVVKVSDGKVIVKLSNSPTGETVQFRVEYKMKPPTDSAAKNEAWKVANTSDAQSSFRLTGLKSAEQYWVRYRAVSDVGVSEASDSVSFTFNENMEITEGINSVPFTFQHIGQSWNVSTLTLFNEIRTKIMTSMGMSRWAVSTIKSEVTNVARNPTIPYIGTIPGGLRAGMALYFQGVVFATGEQFAFNLLTGSNALENIALHFNPRTHDGVFLNSRRNWQWENEEHSAWHAPPKGSAFDVFIVTKTEGYEVYVNGQRYCLFQHRMPVKNVVALHICGEIFINIVGIVENWSTSTFAKELNPGSSRAKFSSIQSDVPNPVCSPSKPYLGKIPEGLRPGVALFFQGVVPLDWSNGFAINLQTGSGYLHDVALHFNPRSDKVALNSCRNGLWEHEDHAIGNPFVVGGAFDIIMVIKPEGYEVMVNGLEFCTFSHRRPVDKVNTLQIKGDVFMNYYGIIKVE